MPALRLILDGPRPAALNMAIDEFLAASQSSGTNAPVLRFYSWDRPSVSIGYFQKVENAVRKFIEFHYRLLPYLQGLFFEHMIKLLG